MNRTQNIKGFTIIEVVLVLAIAGLIFLMVFIALPALQAGQRDTARKSDVANIASAVSNYSGNNRGAFPTTAQIQTSATNVSNNIAKVIVNTTSGAQTIGAVAGNADTGTTAVGVQSGLIVVTPNSKCGASTTTQVLTAGATNRAYTVVTKLEGGGGAAFCQDS